MVRKKCASQIIPAIRYFHEKPDQFDQQAAGPLADILDLQQDVRDRQVSGTSSNSQDV